LGAILTSKGVTAELIADAVHVHPGAMELLLRCLGVRRVVLVTDAMAAAGLRDGEYRLVGHGITVRDGKATLADGTLAGSTTTLDRCVRNAHLKVGVPLPEAVSMASLTPARAMGLCGELGSLQPGKRADLVVIDEGGNVYLTMVGGEIVYESL
jgi:N-acetylglucosamine-6-phosphate deacetylase